MTNLFQIIVTVGLKLFLYLFKHQPHKMAKHTKKIRRQQPTNGLNVFDQFVGSALKELNFYFFSYHN